MTPQKCPLCNGDLSVAPATGERYCPACEPCPTPWDRSDDADPREDVEGDGQGGAHVLSLRRAGIGPAVPRRLFHNPRWVPATQP